MARVVAIVQARTGSTRLPGKVLLPLLGTPMLSMVMRRAARARSVDEVVVATTKSSADDSIVELARREGWRYERGSETDLLDRYVQAARANDAAVVVRITSDCPLIDPVLIDEAVGAFSGAAGGDYASNTLEPRTFPRGLDVEVVTARRARAGVAGGRRPGLAGACDAHISIGIRSGSGCCECPRRRTTRGIAGRSTPGKTTSWYGRSSRRSGGRFRLARGAGARRVEPGVGSLESATCPQKIGPA